MDAVSWLTEGHWPNLSIILSQQFTTVLDLFLVCIKNRPCVHDSNYHITFVIYCGLYIILLLMLMWQTGNCLMFTECSMGYFGSECQFRCYCPGSAPCDRASGHCSAGCSHSRWGIGCLLGNNPCLANFFGFVGFLCTMWCVSWCKDHFVDILITSVLQFHDAVTWVTNAVTWVTKTQ